jgi:hypothetical protein
MKELKRGEQKRKGNITRGKKERKLKRGQDCLLTTGTEACIK